MSDVAKESLLPPSGATPAQPTRGRPLSTERTAAILTAALEELTAEGWSGFRVQNVAARAGAGLATIYRRWSTKEDLVAAAVRRDTLSVLVRTGDSRRDLRSALVFMAEDIGPRAGAIAGLLGAGSEFPIIQEALSAETDSMRRVLVEVIDDILGADHALTTTIVESILSLLIVRTVVLDAQPDPDEFADEIFALIDRVADATPRP